MWHHLYVEGTDRAFDVSTAIHKAIFVLLAAGVKDAAVFSKINDEHSGTHFYFAPQAQVIAVAFKASPCDTPTSRQEVGGLLCGEQTVINRLFL